MYSSFISKMLFIDSFSSKTFYLFDDILKFYWLKCVELSEQYTHIDTFLRILFQWNSILFDHHSFNRFAYQSFSSKKKNWKTENWIYKKKKKTLFCLPVELIVHTATGVMQASQSRGVNKLLLHTAPLLLTQISHAIGSELGYADVEHSNSVIWCTNGLFVWLKREIFVFVFFIYHHLLLACWRFH